MTLTATRPSRAPALALACLMALPLPALSTLSAPSLSADVVIVEHPAASRYADPYYVVHNASAFDIQYFAVSNPRRGNVQALQAGWRGMSLSQAAWDNPALMISFDCAAVVYWQCGSLRPVADVLGSYASNFGSDAYANLFWASTGAPILAGTTSAHFYFNGPIASTFVAWNTAGGVVASGTATPAAAVPEASTLSMLLLGVLALAWRRRAAGGPLRRAVSS